MSVSMQELLRWLETRGVTDERLVAYRECIEQILREAGDQPVEAPHVDAAHRSLQAAGARPRTLAHLRDAGDALRRFQRGAMPAAPTTSPVAAPPRPQASLPVLNAPSQAAPTSVRPVFVLLAAITALLVAAVAAAAALYAWLPRSTLASVEWSAAPPSPEQRETGGAPQRNVVRPADLPQLEGTWQGSDTAHGAQWTVTFSDGARLAAASSLGESYEGEVMIRWDLGVEGDSLPVPPGWGPLDVQIDKASARQAVGKVALGAFSLSAGELKLCGGPPGVATRVRSFESPGSAFRCLTLSKTSSGEVPVATANSPDAGASEATGPGEATLLLDGVAERYQLKTGFFSETRLAQPERAILHFERPASAHSNAPRIVLTLDATRTGRHVADGQAIHDLMFNDKPVAVGALSDGGRAAVLKWVADGGQVYPPKIGTRCEITVVSGYTGSPSGELVVEIPQCSIHSAGIDRTLSNVKLTVKGKLDR